MTSLLTAPALPGAAPSALARPADGKAVAAADTWLSSLHVGMGWPEEQPGGLNRMVAGLVRHLPTVRVSARALVAGSEAVAQRSQGLASPFAALSDPLPRRMLRARQAVRSAVTEDLPDIVAVHFALFGLSVLPAGSRSAVVVHFHGPWAEESVVEGNRAFVGWVKHVIERLAYRRAHRFITLSSAFAEVLHRRYHVDARRIHVVPGGVDVERFRPQRTRAEARLAVGLPGDRPIVVAVRRLARRMGLRELVGAFSRVRAEVPDAMLVIAGDGPMREALERQVAELGLAGRVRLLGRVPDAILPDLFRAADLSVVPSSALEGFGLTSVESLAAGTPALVTPVGGLPEVVRDLSEGLVCDDARADALADRIVAALRGRVSLPTDEACTAYAAERFSWEAVARQTRAVYRTALA